MGEFVTVARLSDLTPGTCRSLDIDGHGIALCNVEGRIFALDNCCPHAGGRLGDGTLYGEHVKCPWHGWRFHVATGARPENPDITVATYEVRIEGDIIKVALPSENPA